MPVLPSAIEENIISFYCSPIAASTDNLCKGGRANLAVVE